jgi:hypothetical protein
MGPIPHLHRVAAPRAFPDDRGRARSRALEALGRALEWQRFIETNAAYFRNRRT